MRKNCFRITIECLGLQIVFAVISIGLYTDFFPDILYSIFTAWLFLWAIHSTYWQLGNKDRKQIRIINRNLSPGETEKKLNIYKGAITGLPFFLVNLTYLIVTCIINENILVTIQSLLQFTFVGFLSPVDDILGLKYFLPRFIVCLAMYITCIGGYMSGAHNYSFFDKYFHKIIYKTKKSSDKNDK